MQIDLIETFLDLCETRSFNRTADRMGVTQSTVSGRVKALERVLGARLFTRSRAGTDLTTEGLRFEPHARGLRHGWVEALHATRDAGPAAMTLRIGIQHDLAANHIGDWIGGFRGLLPEAGFYIETDYSTQMVSDLIGGALDMAMLFTPRAHPDLFFDTVGEISYVMVSTDTDRLAGVRPDSYLLANYSPAFSRAHAAMHPALSAATVSSGQDAAVAGLVTALGGAAYVLAETAGDLARAGLARRVRDAPAIAQSVYAAIHLRNRHRGPHRRLISQLRGHFATGTARRGR